MKAKVTRKELSRHYNCISVGNNNLQYLLRFESPRFYHAGVYGWNFDAYVLEHDNRSICITTGYRSTIDNCEYRSTYALEKEYDDKAWEICRSSMSQYAIQKEVHKLLHEYLSKVMGESNVSQ